jgi:hypothetical protein
VNAYIVYCRVMEQNDVPRKERMSQYEFRKSVALAWINPGQYDIRRKEGKGHKRKQAAAVLEFKTPSAAKKARTELSARSSRVRKQAAQKDETEIEEEVAKVASRAPRVSDASLQPQGSLQIRLRRNLHHWPCLASKPDQKCALHRWASGIEYKCQVMMCEDCNVHLCVACFKAFHTVQDIVAQKSSLAKVFVQAQKQKVEKRQKTVSNSVDAFLEGIVARSTQEAAEMTLHSV